jgi:transposase
MGAVMDLKALFSLSDHHEALSKDGDGAKGSRPPVNPVIMCNALILQAQRNFSDARMEFMIRDRLSWLRFLGLSFGERRPDENMTRPFRSRLTETGALKRVMKAFDRDLPKKGYIPMSVQIVDASLVPAPSGVPRANARRSRQA